MQSYDPQKAARVWQRVQAQKEESEPRGSDLPGLIMSERMAAASYHQLSRMMQGRDGERLRQMAREEENHAACLTGMYSMITGEHPAVQRPPVGREPAALMLRKSCSGEMQSIKAYEARSSDPEYGPVFASMAAQEREHLRSVVEMLGRMEKK